MRVAVLSLTRDRLPYTQHCFQTLREKAGCGYDHYVLDQGSRDGTVEWLDAQDDLDVTFLNENIGICPALNLLLEEALNPADYDVVVKFDNDCEVLSPNTLNAVSALALEHDAILSPRIHGLRNPPPILKHDNGIDQTAVIGGVFMAVPARVFADGYRHDETNPVWGGDDVNLCAWFRRHGGTVGYVTGYDANHYLSTDGQVADIPEYFQRRVMEGGPAR